MKKMLSAILGLLASSLVSSHALAVDPNYSFTGCTGFNIGFGLSVTHEAEGEIKCYDTYSTVPTKLESVLLNQPSGVNYDVYVYWYDSSTGSLVFKTSGTSTGNVDERPQVIVPAGNYVIYTVATSGFSAIPFVVGALSYPTFDQHEMNDTALTATQL